MNTIFLGTTAEVLFLQVHTTYTHYSMCTIYLQEQFAALGVLK